jgi:Uncharacterised protein family (UPF0014)
VNPPTDLLPSLVGVGVLAAVTTVVLAAFRVPGLWSPLLAIVRGAVQLAVISVLLTGLITDARLIALTLVAMFVIAASVATGRIGWSRRHAAMMTTSIVSGVVFATTIVFATGALELTARYALAIGAIVIGNAMSIATLTGRMFTRGIVDHWDEVEGWLALGARPLDRPDQDDRSRRAAGRLRRRDLRGDLAAGGGPVPDRRARGHHGGRGGHIRARRALDGTGAGETRRPALAAGMRERPRPVLGPGALRLCAGRRGRWVRRRESRPRSR